MLHELFLALSGHPSPLLSKEPLSKSLSSTLSPSEIALLRAIAHLGNLHINVREQCSIVSSTHASVICRAVATAIASTHLARFQKAIVQVERDLLLEDASLVGAYQVVPLSAVAGAFDGWGQKLEWLRTVLAFIIDVNAEKESRPSSVSPATGAALIDRIRSEARTGYPSIEEIAHDLGKVAELAWLRQVSTWILYGKLPTIGASDFFIHRIPDTGIGPTSEAWEVRSALCPNFLTPSTAHSIFFIGKSVNHIRTKGSTATNFLSKHVYRASSDTEPSSASPEVSLIAGHLNLLSSLSYPISSTTLTRTIRAIRVSLSQNALQNLLSLAEILQVLRVFREFFLLQCGEFAIALINAADSCLASKAQRSAYTAKSGDVRLSGAMIRENEVAATLNQAWATLASLQGIDDDEDQELEVARDLVCMRIKKVRSRNMPAAQSLPGSVTDVQPRLSDLFGDVLLATPIVLDLKITSPLDLFLTPNDTEMYSQIHAFLLSIRRAQSHSSDLWKLASLRKEHSTSRLVINRIGDAGKDSAKVEELRRHRNRRMRQVWTVVGLVTSFLVELSEYFHGEVVSRSWMTFESWLHPNTAQDRSSTGLVRKTQDQQDPTEEQLTDPAILPQTMHDPETVMLAHQAFLGSLSHALLLDDGKFVHSLRALLIRVDHIVGLMGRLSDLRIVSLVHASHLGLQQSPEEDELTNNIDGVCKDIKQDIETLKVRLRELDTERLGENLGAVSLDEGRIAFAPWQSAGLDRLLLKLDSSFSSD